MKNAVIKTGLKLGPLLAYEQDIITFFSPFNQLLSLDLAAKVCDRMNHVSDLGAQKHENWVTELNELMKKYGDGDTDAVTEPWPTQDR